MIDKFQKLRQATQNREPFFNPTGKPIPALFRATELAGEAGEVANAVKKLARYEMGMAGGSPDRTNLKEEIGDVLISLELLAQHYEIDLWEAVAEKFNKTSDKHKMPIKMEV
jgi:NTP pyrophosphatase (non-canonical NTP hydrolase)